ncbi:MULTISPECIES: hypothetical protein [unclassified Curtobacterium]|uniref:hypothetical protein n=1 Tax=unclassified Curtobacterium TaxID=257496 RepID=UPI000F4BBDB1|nr:MULTISPECIES: hypothetical protein [unclassified Curtobacterium]ROP65660.1 hypothetical protein EDF55_0098 [Curtobacterium sp. ZW137]TCK63102.1 hypothetical protein EDF27_2767 [Curtobacterium sp. PhB136]
MAVRTRDQEPPAAPAFVAVLLGCIALYLGLVIPSESMVRHVVLAVVFGVVGLLSGWRAIAISGRRRAPRAWAWVGIVLGGIGLVALLYQVLFMATGGALPAPFWSPYATH